MASESIVVVGMGRVSGKLGPAYIHKPGYPPMLAYELPESSLKSALDGARLVHFDVRLPETCLRVANEAAANCRALRARASLPLRRIRALPHSVDREIV